MLQFCSIRSFKFVNNTSLSAVINARASENCNACATVKQQVLKSLFTHRPLLSEVKLQSIYSMRPVETRMFKQGYM